MCERIICRSATVLTIHHVAEQGSFWADFRLTNCTSAFSLCAASNFLETHFLKGGILFADKITTVSERHKREIQTPEFGCGLDLVLRENAPQTQSILHGADYARWIPETDKLLPANYTPASLWANGFVAMRFKWLRLEPKPRGPVCRMVTRVVGEKGFDILVPLLDRLLSDRRSAHHSRRRRPAYETALAGRDAKFRRGCLPKNLR